jgi:hypothetical protein
MGNSVSKRNSHDLDIPETPSDNYNLPVMRDVRYGVLSVACNVQSPRIRPGVQPLRPVVFFSLIDTRDEARVVKTARKARWPYMAKS